MQQRSKTKNMTGTPIKDPQRLYPGQTLFMVTVNKINKSKDYASKVIGDQIQFAALKDIKIKSLELNEGETGVIINKSSENLRVPFDQNNLISEGDGSLFDEEKNAQAIAASINSVNIEKIEAIQEEGEQAKSFLKQLLKEGA